MSTERSHELYEILLMKAVDGLLSAEEKSKLDEHLEGCAACRTELADFREIKKSTDAMTQRILRDAQIEPPREGPGARSVLGAGFALLLVGALTLIGFGLYALMSDPTVPVLMKAGTGAGGLGALVLLAYAVRIRLRAMRKDPYKEVDL